MSDTVNEQILREELVEHYRLVAERGLNELSSGNLSVRFGDDRMLISPTGAAAESITTDSIVNISLDGDWEGGRKPSSEWRMHAAIYERHAEAQAVVHTHSDYCVAVASHLKPLPGFHYLVGSFGGNDVPCVPYSTFGTQALADDAAEALTHRTACLLGKHGMICRAPNLKRAVNQAHRLEIMCRQYVLARQLGEPERLTDTEWGEFFERARQNQYGKEI
ncbi:MAG: class II aldolase/adducin family protein [Gammaproteobacteria bacterium]|nr:class II aldolase/adducin family protein [Gammaproteobacteria bacterium]